MERDKNCSALVARSRPSTRFHPLRQQKNQKVQSDKVQQGKAIRRRRQSYKAVGI